MLPDDRKTHKPVISLSCRTHLFVLGSWPETPFPMHSWCLVKTHNHPSLSGHVSSACSYHWMRSEHTLSTEVPFRGPEGHCWNPSNGFKKTYHRRQAGWPWGKRCSQRPWCFLLRCSVEVLRCWGQQYLLSYLSSSFHSSVSLTRALFISSSTSLTLSGLQFYHPRARKSKNKQSSSISRKFSRYSGDEEGLSENSRFF